MATGDDPLDLARETIEAIPLPDWTDSRKTDANHPPPLAPGQCHVWHARSDDAHPRICRLLDAVERVRLATLRRQVDRDHFIVGCGIVRVALSAYLGQSPAAIPISRACPQCGQPHGKPRLAPLGNPDVRFSISHASGRVVAAFGLGTSVGVDIEQIDPLRSVERLFPYALTTDERAVLRSKSEEERGEGFLVYWTRKEALLKAAGLGLAVSPASFGVSAPDDSPRLLHWSHDSHLATWPTMFDLEVEAGFIAAVAVMGRCQAVVSIDGSTFLAH